MDAHISKIQTPWENPPAIGDAIEVAEGVLWLRLPLPMKLDHVNCYALDDGDGWTIVDTGFGGAKNKAIWQKILTGPLQGKGVNRVIGTHHHPDHIGLAGWFQRDYDAALLMSRVAWLTARMLTLDEQAVPAAENIRFWTQCGMAPDMLATRKSERPFNFCDVVEPMPQGFTRLDQGDVIEIGGRTWDIHLGNGHAPHHLTFWSRDDHLVLCGDQIISSISPNVGVYATEPDADPLGDWLESCERLAKLTQPDQLALSGHKLPFTGLPFRMRQLMENHHGALGRLRDHLKTPKTAAECFAPLFKRQIGPAEYGLALVEAMAHVSHLHKLGEIEREIRADGAYIWRVK